MRVVVSLTTIPSRIDGLGPTINSLLNQSYKPDEIVLNLPRICLKENCGYTIPSFLWKSISVYQCDDYGPITKLLPTVLREKDLDTRIITVDDDVIYSDRTIEFLVKDGYNSEDRVIGMMGNIWEKKGKHLDLFIHSEKVEGECVVDVLGGYRGVCYRRGLLEEDIFSDFEIVSELAGCNILDDDAFMARYLEKKDIRRYVLGGMPLSNDGHKGFNFNFATVPDGSGIFMNSVLGHGIAKHHKALKAYYGY